MATDEELAWHYTTAEGLLSILSYHSLRATSAAFMNDAAEMKSGTEAFRAHFDARADELSEPVKAHIRESGILSGSGPFSNFLLSASTDADSLTLWRNYGGGQVAYSVGLDRSCSLAPLAQSAEERHPNPPANFYDREVDYSDDGEPFYVDPDPDEPFCMGGGWENVTYISGPGDPAIARHFDELIANFERKAGRFAIPLWALTNSATDFMKDAGFEDEDEVRSVHWVTPAWKFVKHRPTRFGLVPYIELTGEADAAGDFATVRHRLPIRSITIGPTPVKEDARRSLRMLLDNLGYGDVEIRLSVTPYR